MQVLDAVRARSGDRARARARRVVPQAGHDGRGAPPRAGRQLVHRGAPDRQADRARHALRNGGPDVRAGRAPRDERAGARRRRRSGRSVAVREQPSKSRSGTASACTSPTAARSCSVIRAGSARSSSIPTSRVSGPTRSRSRARQLEHALGVRTAPVKAVLDGSGAHRRAREPAGRRVAVAGGDRPGAPGGRDRRRRAPHVAQAHPEPRCACSAGGAVPTPATCLAISKPVPA